MKKIRLYGVFCVILLTAIVVVLIWNHNKKDMEEKESYDDGMVQVDLDSIYLKDSGVQIDFSEVIIGNEKERRKLIVFEQEATVSTQLTDRLIKKLDIEWLKKTQEVSYTGKGYFVVDLDKLTKKDVVEDKNKKMITIKIGHAYLEAIEIDPEKIMINDVKESFLAKGDIKLSMEDYNVIERELKNRLEERFQVVANGQKADDIALKMVKEVYGPIVKAMDSSYSVEVEFK